MRLLIRHETRYAYDRPVRFGTHRLLVRPRDSHAIRIAEASLTFSPRASTRWSFDAYGNSICWLTPTGEADELRIVSDLIIERFPAPLSPLRIEDPRTAMPIVYDRDDRAVLAPYLEPVSDDPDSALLTWLRTQIGSPGEPALEFLLRFNAAIHERFDYSTRIEEGTQEPTLTLALGRGACRDLAWLMVEALRRLGFAARFVTGYLYCPAQSPNAVRGAGATHAWCEVFLPGLGWTEFDPTNGLAESPDLIPVAVSRTPAEAAPIMGEIIGDPGGSSLFVDVEVSPAGPFQAAA